MRSMIKEYDMYQAGEYIKESSDDEMKMWALFHQLGPYEPKMNFLRMWDKVLKRTELLLWVALIGMFIIGIFLGYIMGYDFAKWLCGLGKL